MFIKRGPNLLLLFEISLTGLFLHAEPNMRMGNSSMDGTDGSQLFEDTSGVAAGPQAGYRWDTV